MAELGLDELNSITVRVDELVDRSVGGESPMRLQIYDRQYPVPCSVTGGSKWSPWKWVDRYAVSGQQCGPRSFAFLDPVEGIPDLLQIPLGVHNCSACCITFCHQWGKETPLYDNIQICLLGSSTVDVPVLETEPETPLEAAGAVSWRMSRQPLGSHSELILEVRDDGTHVRAEIFDAGGRVVHMLLDRRLGPGIHRLSLRESLGKRESLGVAFLRVSGPWGSGTEKLIQVR